MEERIVRPDGAIRVLLSKAEVIKGEKGELTRIVGICQDITDQKRAEAALRYRSDFENLITEISTYFINLSPEAHSKSFQRKCFRGSWGSYTVARPYTSPLLMTFPWKHAPKEPS